MIEFLLAEIALAIGVGFVAQRWKGRTGAFWAFATFVVQMVVLVLVVGSVMMQPQAAATMHTTSGTVATHLMTMGAGLLMLLVVATLPSRKR